MNANASCAGEGYDKRMDAIESEFPPKRMLRFEKRLGLKAIAAKRSTRFI
jgi:hypothetical protein